jgi:hypothetical protein
MYLGYIIQTEKGNGYKKEEAAEVESILLEKLATVVTNFSKKLFELEAHKIIDADGLCKRIAVVTKEFPEDLKLRPVLASLDLAAYPVLMERELLRVENIEGKVEGGYSFMVGNQLVNGLCGLFVYSKSLAETKNITGLTEISSKINGILNAHKLY